MLANQIIKMKVISDKMTSAIHFAKIVLLKYKKINHWQFADFFSLPAIGTQHVYQNNL